MHRPLQIIIMTIIVMVPVASADSTTACRTDYGEGALACVARDTGRDDTTEGSDRVGHKAGECMRIEKLLANPQTRQLMMQEPEGKRTVWWYAGNCPLGKRKG
jgi:hypothetical protein